MGTGSGTVVSFYATIQGTATHSMALNRPEHIEIVIDRERYRPGDTARVLVRSPFPGTLLLTVEAECVLERQV